MQVVSLVQLIELSWVPDGIEVVNCQVEKLFVLSEIAPPPEATPTAMQVVAVEQDKDSR